MDVLPFKSVTTLELNIYHVWVHPRRHHSSELFLVKSMQLLWTVYLVIHSSKLIEFYLAVSWSNSSPFTEFILELKCWCCFFTIKLQIQWIPSMSWLFFHLQFPRYTTRELKDLHHWGRLYQMLKLHTSRTWWTCSLHCLLGIQLIWWSRKFLGSSCFNSKDFCTSQMYSNFCPYHKFAGYRTVMEQDLWRNKTVLFFKISSS
jgi:hypothetical protein